MTSRASSSAATACSRVTEGNSLTRFAIERAGIEDFRWHDLRHTWASWHVQAGTPLHVLQELGGWETAEMVRRYAHLTADHLAPYADRLCGLRVVEGEADGTNKAQA